jgi:hypothetical protein
MARGLLALAAIALIALGWFAFSKTDHIAPAIAPRESSNASASTATLEAPKVEDARATDSSAPTTPSAPATNVDGVTIVGRVLRSDRSPAKGAALALRFENVDDRGKVLASTDGPRTTAGADGRFRLMFDAQRSTVVHLEAVLAQCAIPRWSWRELEPGQFLDIGDVVLGRAATLEARVVDAHGTEFSTGWTVTVDPAGAGNLAPFGTPQDRKLDAQHPVARFENLAVGTVEVNAEHEVWFGSKRVIVELRAGETTSVDLPYEGPDPGGIIHVVARSEPISVFGSALTELTLIDPSGKEHALPTRFEGSSQFVAKDLTAGPYSIEVRDPRFKHWRVDGVMPGTHVEAQLTGNSALVLAVATDDRPMDLRVTLKWPEFEHFAQNFADVVSSVLPLPADGRIVDLFPGDIELTAHARGWVPIQVKIVKLAPNEERKITLAFDRGARISGRVALADHTGVRDVDVRAALRSEDRDSTQYTSDGESTPSAMHTHTDADGRFEFEGIAAGEWTLRAIVAPAVHRFVDLQVAQGHDMSGIEIEVPSSSRLIGHVIAPEDLPLAQLSIVTKPVLQGAAKSAYDAVVSEFDTRAIQTSVRSDGSFRSPLVPAGDVDVELVLPRVRRTLGFMASSEASGPTVELGRVTLPPNGELDRTFDLRGRIPARAVVHVAVDGTIVPGCSVVSQVRGAKRIAASGDVNEEGTATLSWMPEGSYDIFVFAPNLEWVTQAPATLAVSLATSARSDVDVHLDAHDVEVVGPDKKPIADGARITIVRRSFPIASDHGASAVVKSGRIRVNLPTGSYLLTHTDREGSPLASARMEWPDTTRLEFARDE